MEGETFPGSIFVRVPFPMRSITKQTKFLTKTYLRSLDFVVNRFLMKLFKTTDINVVETCQQYLSFRFRLPSDILQKRTKKFLDNTN